MNRWLVIELVSKSQFGSGQVRGDLIGSGHVGFHTRDVVHGPPHMVLEPVARPKVIHIDDTFADGLTLNIEGLDRNIKIIPLGSAVISRLSDFW